MYVYPQSITYSNQWNVTLTCIDTAGIPRPLLIWRRQNNRNPIEQSRTIRIHNGVLSIIMATKDHEGTREYSILPLNFLFLQGFMNVLEVTQQVKISKQLNLSMLV